MKLRNNLSLGVTLAALIAGTPALAEPAGMSKQIDQLQQQINALQKQLEQLQSQVKTSQDQAQAAEVQAAQAQAAVAAKPVAAPDPNEPVKMMTSRAKHVDGKPDAPWHFGIASADGKNSVELTGRLQLDAGAYDYKPDTTTTTPRNLSTGINARRARIGITGKFFGDFNYGLIYDFGGSTDAVPATVTSNNPTCTTTAAGTPLKYTTACTAGSNVVSGSGIENAYIQYAGWKPLYIDLGYVDSLYSLEESSGSNDIIFMERATPQQIATQFGAGDNRFVFGGHWNNDNIWVGAYATGPTSGAVHNDSSYGGSGNSLSAFGRALYRYKFGDLGFIHIGGDIIGLIEPARALNATASNQVRALSLSDRPELRIDSNTLVSTGTIPNVKNGQVYSGEVAAGFGPVFMQGEYFHYKVTRDPIAFNAAFPSTYTDFDFDGGYIAATYSITGETRQYNATNGAYTNPRPAHPFDFNGGAPTGWGAFEVAGRFSEIGLDDKYNGTSGIEGGFQRVWTAGLNWFPNSNVEFMLNYLHGTIDKANSAGIRTGSEFNAVAARARLQW